MTTMTMMMSVRLPRQLLRQRNVQAGGERSLSDAGVFQLRPLVWRGTGLRGGGPARARWRHSCVRQMPACTGQLCVWEPAHCPWASSASSGLLHLKFVLSVVDWVGQVCPASRCIPGMFSF